VKKKDEMTNLSEPMLQPPRFTEEFGSKSLPKINTVEPPSQSIIAKSPEKLLSFSKEALQTFKLLQELKWASYILTIQIYNATTSPLELYFEILHGKMQHENELYLRHTQRLFLSVDQQEIVSFGKGDMTTYGIEIHGRIVASLEAGLSGDVLHDDLHWFVPFKTVRPCEFRDESRKRLKVFVFPSRPQRDLTLRQMIFSYVLQ